MTAWLEYGLSNALAASALAMMALAVTRVARRPQWAFAAWMLVLAKLLAPPIFSLPLPTVRPQSVAAEAAPIESSRRELPVVLPVAVEAPEPGPQRIAAPATAAAPFDAVAAEPTFALSPAAGLMIVWLGISACWLAIAVARTWRFARLLSRAEPAPDGLQDEVDQLAARIGLRRGPRVRVVRRDVPPLVWALFRKPAILLPAGLLPLLSVEERATVLAHELAHVKRRDHWARLVELAAIGLFWWLPIAWWARRNAERAAEQCCDAEVLGLLPGAAHAYASALVTTTDFLSDFPRPLPLGASGFSQLTHVKRRIEMILSASPVRPVTRRLRFVPLAVALVVLPVSLRALWAEPGEAPAERRSTEASASAGKTEAQSAPGVQALEQRLDRLEKMIEALAARSQPAAEAPRSSEASPAPATVAEAPAEAPVTSEAAPVTAEAAPVTAEAAEANAARQTRDFEDAIFRELGKAVSDASTQLELQQSNAARLAAAKRQLKAVQAAYEAKTVSFDQLLEAQRRTVDAEMSFCRASSELCTDPFRKPYLMAVSASLVADRARDAAHETWRQRTRTQYDAGLPADAEMAQAQEQYFAFKKMAEKLRKETEEAARRMPG